MPNYILQRTFADGIARGLQQGSGELIRKMAWGNSWRQIRIGIHMAITPNGTSNITGTRHTFGICSGTNAGYNSTSTLFWMGMFVNHQNEVAGQTLTYNAGGGNPYYNQGSVQSMVGIHYGATASNQGFGGSTLYAIPTNGGSIQRRVGIALDIWKPGVTGGGGATSYQFRPFGQNAAVSTDMLLYTFRNNMLASSPNTWLTTSTTIAQPFVETGRPLDCCSMYWNLDSFPLEIYEWYVVRFQ